MQKFIFMLMVVLAALLVAGAWMNPSAGQTTEDLSLVDSDFDGCNDAEEIAMGQDPNNFFDFPDVVRDNLIDTLDTAFMSFYWRSEFGELLYNVNYDINDGTGANGPNGVIDILDMQVVYSRFGMSCRGVPLPSLEQVCKEEQTKAEAEGVTDFSCSGSGEAAGIQVDVAGVSDRKALVEYGPDFVLVTTLDVAAESDSDGGAASGDPDVFTYCLPDRVCRTTLTKEAELVHFRGRGPNCAWLEYKQRYKTYTPWNAIFDVETPIGRSGSSFPCNEQSREVWINRSGEPFWAESGASIHWVVGIPTPWGVVGVRSFHPEVGAFFNSNFEVRWR